MRLPLRLPSKFLIHRSPRADIYYSLTYSILELGKQTVLTLSSGLKIGVFGGQFSLEHFTSPSLVSPDLPYFTSTSLDSFSSAFSTSNLDILLSHSWPSQITRHSEKPLSETISKQEVERWGFPALQKLLAQAKPKYCFVGNQNLFWEREPFIHPQSSSSTSNGQEAISPSATRFISLGHFNNPTKQRWFYAFSVTPTSHTLSSAHASVEIPSNVTPYPFDLLYGQQSNIRGVKRPLPNEDYDAQGGHYIFGETPGLPENGRKKRHGEPPQNYKCRICSVPGHFIQDCPEKVDAAPSLRKAPDAVPPPETYVCRLCNVQGHWIQDCPSAGRDKNSRKDGGPFKEIAPEDCWFCLSNPNLTKHLIASIGSETYLTLPKGQLLDTKDQRTLVPGGGHCLIIPIAHYPTLSSVPSELSAPIYAEIDAYKRALRSCYAKYGSQPLSFEVSRSGPGAKSGHAHIQICPVPDTLVKDSGRIFMDEAQKAGYEFVSDREDRNTKDIEMTLQGGNYFRVDLPDASKLVHRIRPGERFNLQFGRATTALLLSIGHRSDWKTCAKGDDEEAADCRNFKEAFSEWDPNGQ